MNNINFSDWIFDVAEKFKSLSSQQQQETFQALLKETTPEMRYKSLIFVQSLLKKNILVRLPVELQEYICNYVDVKSLLTACSVSKEWNRVISSLTEVWHKKYFALGAGTVEEKDHYWKTKCISILKLLMGISNGSSFFHRKIPAHFSTPTHVTGLHYCHGHLVGCTGDQVGVWRTKNFEFLGMFTAPYWVSCLQMDNSGMICFGHSSGHVSTWNLNYLDNSCTPVLHHTFHGHTGVVMSVSLSMEMDLMVSGASDYTAKLWCVSTKLLIKTISDQNHWVIYVSLIPVVGEVNTKTLFQNKHSLLLKTRENIKVFSWPQMSDCQYGDITCLESSVLQFLPNAVNYIQPPGCFINAGNVVYINQSKATDDTGFAEIVFEDLKSKTCVRRLSSPHIVRKLLAVGDKFAVILLSHFSCSKFNLVIIELANGTIIGGCHLPNSSSSTPDLAQITFGEVGWLNGLVHQDPETVLVAVGMLNGHIHIVTWQDCFTSCSG